MTLCLRLLDHPCLPLTPWYPRETRKLAGLPMDRQEQGGAALPSDETSCSKDLETSHQHSPQTRGLGACLAPCTHEDADTRMLLHVEDAEKRGYLHRGLRCYSPCGGSSRMSQNR